MQIGANISQLFLSASGFLHLFVLPMNLYPGMSANSFPDNNTKTH